MSTIHDVALHAGVSITTVSHVVNNTRPVSDKGRERVELAIRDLGYVPSAVARSLKSNTTRTLGMLIPNSANPYFSEIARIVEDRCFSAGYTLIVCNTDDEPHRQSVYLQVLAERRIDGLIVVSTGDDDSLRAQLHGLKMPTVLVDREIDDPSCDLVEAAHLNGGLLAVRHLLMLGHRRIACIGGLAGVRSGEQRIEGWRLAHAEASVAIGGMGGAEGIERIEGGGSGSGSGSGDTLLWRGGFSCQGGYEAMHAILRTAHPPSAIFVCNDLMAMGVLRAAHEAGLRVPEDMSIVGFDDIELSSYTSPPLTTVAQPKERLGVMAVDMLLERVTGRRHEVCKVVLQPELRVRESTAPYSGPDGGPHSGPREPGTASRLHIGRLS